MAIRGFELGTETDRMFADQERMRREREAGKTEQFAQVEQMIAEGAKPITIKDIGYFGLSVAPVTGDVVRIVEVGGNLNYNTTLVLRTPESSGTPIQGDGTGTLFGDRITPYPSGELVVQTANAAFALIYLGPTDSNNQVGIPTSVLGWWLMEV